MDNKINKFCNNENKIIGKWISVNGQTKKDSNCERIEFLVENYLQKITDSEDGWNKLYLDKNDGRYWELRYNNSDYHGGGPPTLILLKDEELIQKYPYVKR